RAIFVGCFSTLTHMVTSSLSFFFTSRRRHTRSKRDWSSDVCSSDLPMKIWRQVSQEYLLQVISEKKAYVKSLRQQVMAVLLQKWHRNTLKHQHLSLNKIQKSNYFLT